LDFIPKKYKFKKSDIAKLTTIGYKISSNGVTPFEDILVKKFPNLNLVSLLEVVEKQFSGTTNHKIFRSLELVEEFGTLEILFWNREENENDILIFNRKFSNINGSIEVEHKFCIIPIGSRNKGLIKPVFRESLQQYVNMKANRILVHAGLSGGGYTWARFGFVAVNKKEVESILHKAKSKLNIKEFEVVKKIYNIYYTNNPNGDSFPIDLWASLDYMKPILMGSDWHGVIDLNNKNQFRNFVDYVSR
jgi:hypothetical protein